ncbi:MAG: hypothetical protein DBY36_06200 [Clostridiales bacterium]|nr:MAG: hypothetical protein DBY36_06200 [Clostridiales bacterium]
MTLHNDTRRRCFSAGMIFLLMSTTLQNMAVENPRPSHGAYMRTNRLWKKFVGQRYEYDALSVVSAFDDRYFADNNVGVSQDFSLVFCKKSTLDQLTLCFAHQKD